MNNHFDENTHRRGSDSVKWDVKENELPMWVADMDFKVAPCIQAALQKRLDHGVFGYTYADEEWSLAYAHFFSRRFHWNLKPKDLVFSLGVVPILSSSVRALVQPGEEVVVFSPVYNIFYNSIRNNGCKIVEVPLLYQNGAFDLDYESIEKAFASPKAKLCIFCNPHNPVGRIWKKEELERLLELAKKHDVLLLSDEIHGLVTRPGTRYVPMLSIPGAEEVAFSALSPTKAFNLAGIHTAAACIPNPKIRALVERRLNTDEVAEPNVFSCVASTAAFNEGEPWLDEALAYLFGNRDFAVSFIQKEIPDLLPIDGDATYLLWVDCRKICSDSKEFAEFLREKVGLFVNSGMTYGSGGEGFLRINLAARRKDVIEGLERLKKGVALYLESRC